MADLTRYKEAVERLWSASGFARLSIAIIDLIEQHGVSQNEMLTYRTFAQVLGTEVSEKLVAAVAILSNEKVHVLDRHALFIDGDFEEEIALEEFTDALSGRPLADPRTGIAVKDPLSHLMPYFVPSKSVREALGE